MKVKVSLMVDELEVKEEILEIEDRNLEELSEEEIEAVIEMKIKSWIDRLITVPWEVMD